MRKWIDTATSGLLFATVAAVLVASPWLFGAWEMWWFWPLAGLLFASVLMFSLRLVFLGRGYRPRTPENRRLARLLLVGWLPFLVYVVIRVRQVPVYLDAERSLLLFSTPLLLGAVIVFGLSRRQVIGLFFVLMVNFLALALYGVLNWYDNYGEFVMWQPGYPQYILDERASGSYYCPNHFAGVMEMGFLAAVALLITRHGRWWLKALAVPLLGLSTWAILLTKSRGAMLSLAAVAVLVLLIGFLQWRPLLRHGLVLLVVAVSVGGGALAVTLDIPFVQRFRRYPWRQIEYASRYQMISGALRAWRSAPVLGIGPGMHRHLWPHFAAGPDGDREIPRWPRFANDTFHSYEVHSDWVQLLEEYGVVGLLLFLWAVGATTTPFVQALRREHQRQRSAVWRAPGRLDYPVIMSALLAGMVMAVHSLGDFNLQMPATVWLLGGLTGIAMALILRDTAHYTTHYRAPAEGSLPDGASVGS